MRVNPTYSMSTSNLGDEIQFKGGGLCHPEFWPYKIFFVKTKNLDLDLDLMILAPLSSPTFPKPPRFSKYLSFL